MVVAAPSRVGLSQGYVTQFYDEMSARSFFNQVRVCRTNADVMTTERDACMCRACVCGGPPDHPFPYLPLLLLLLPLLLLPLTGSASTSAN